MRILIVEDNEAVRSAIRRALTARGHEIVEAATAAEGRVAVTDICGFEAGGVGDEHGQPMAPREISEARSQPGELRAGSRIRLLDALAAANAEDGVDDHDP